MFAVYEMFNTSKSNTFTPNMTNITKYQVLNLLASTVRGLLNRFRPHRNLEYVKKVFTMIPMFTYIHQNFLLLVLSEAKLKVDQFSL